MASKINTDKYLGQAYASPYTQELFGVDKKDEFEKHLRLHVRANNAAVKVGNAKNERLQLWATLRQAATCLNDVPGLLNNLPSTLVAHYRKAASFKSDSNAGWPLTFKDKPAIELQSITHASPLGQETNWGGRDESRPSRLLGLRGNANENLNYQFSEAKRESGIETSNSTYVLFADDWPFVAKMALRATFEKTIILPGKTIFKSSSIKPEYTRFWNDINAYSLEHVGMPYEKLTGMRDALGLSGIDLDIMMQAYATRNSDNFLGTPMTLSLPEGIEDAANFGKLP